MKPHMRLLGVLIAPGAFALPAAAQSDAKLIF